MTRRDLALIVCGILVGAVGSICIQSSAQMKLELGTGHTLYEWREAGTWCQPNNFSCNQDFHPPSWALTLRDKFKNSNFGWELGYHDLGSYRFDTLVTNLDGEQYHPDQPCNQITAQNCLARTQGRGYAEGVALGATYGRNFYGFDWNAGGGVFLFHSDQHTTITNIQFCNDAERPCGQDSPYNHMNGTHWTPYLSARICWRFLCSAAYFFQKVYEQGSGYDGDVGATGGITRQFLPLSVATTF